MSVSKDQFSEGLIWDDWVELLAGDRPEWQQRFDRAALGELRADFQSVPTPRYVLCLFDPESEAAQETVPVLAKACDQAGVSGGVDLRLFPIDDHPELADQYFAGTDRSLPACVVFDPDWIQIGLWRLRPETRQEDDWMRPTLRAFLEALLGQPNHPWQGHQNYSEHRHKQAERAPGSP